jgi:hypothetical protein
VRQGSADTAVEWANPKAAVCGRNADQHPRGLGTLPDHRAKRRPTQSQERARDFQSEFGSGEIATALDGKVIVGKVHRSRSEGVLEPLLDGVRQHTGRYRLRYGVRSNAERKEAKGRVAGSAGQRHADRLCKAALDLLGCDDLAVDLGGGGAIRTDRGFRLLAVFRLHRRRDRDGALGRNLLIEADDAGDHEELSPRRSDVLDKFEIDGDEARRHDCADDARARRHD